MASEAEGREGRERTYWGLESKNCDSCKNSAALLFCRADSAFLCDRCDARVHTANKLASRHERVWLCEVCEQAPAAVTCKADAAALCVTCDSDIHSANPLARRHERFPVVPFLDFPSSVVKSSAAADGFLYKTLDDEEEDIKSADYFFSDVDPYLDLDYASSMDTKFHQTDSVVLVQTKTTGGPTPPPPPIIASDGCIDLDFTRSNPSYSTYSLSSSEVGVVPDGMGDVSNGYGGGRSGNPTAVMNREARVMRYREKRKNRRFEKTIRYASRKAYAETRPRIRGRFAKRAEVESEVNRTYSSAAAAAIMVDGGYGVVPSF